MAKAAIKIEGLGRLRGKLRKLDDLEGIKYAMVAGAKHVKAKVAEYPPESEANRPSETGRWYERGYGTRWPGGGKKTSEMLGRKWSPPQVRDGGLTVVIGNNVSYGVYVQDDDHQARFHKKNKWKTIQDVAAEEADRVNEYIKDAVDKILRKG